MNKEERKATREARLIAALAQAPSRTRTGHADSAIKQAAREQAHALKLAAARDALDARDREAEREHAARFGRLEVLGKLATGLKKDESKLSRWIERRTNDLNDAGQTISDEMRAHQQRELAGWLVELADVRQRVESIKLERGTLYGQPIMPSDLAPNGRFMRSIRYHARTVTFTHMTAREDDILSEAIVLCYLDPEGSLTEVTRGYVKSSNRGGRKVGDAITEMVPTIGGMYKGIKRAYRDAIDQARQIRAGLIGVRSLDELAAGGIEPTLHFKHYGIQHVDPADLPWDAVVSGRVADATMSRWAMIDADQRARAAKAEQEAIEAARIEAIEAARPAVGATNAGAWEVDRILIEALIDGESLADLAAIEGVTPSTLAARLSKWQHTRGLASA